VLQEHMRGEAVTQRVRPESRVKTTGVPCFDERGPRGCIGQMGQRSPAGKEPARAVVDLPDVAEHLKDRFGQGENTLLVSLADDAQHHLPGVDRRDGERDGLGNAQAVGIDEGEAAAIDGLFQGGDQAAAVVVSADVGQPLPAWLADFFFVNRGQS
jgi:hypothetical protein